MTAASVLHVVVEREVASDAFGVALLLGSASAADWWPGLRRSAPVPAPRRPLALLRSRRPAPGVLVSAVLPAPVSPALDTPPVPTTLLLRARPPRREEGGVFTLALSLHDPRQPDGPPVLAGELRLLPGAGPGAVPAAPRSRAVLSLGWTLPEPRADDAEAFAPHWRAAAERFLANLAAAAELRAAAA